MSDSVSFPSVNEISVFQSTSTVGACFCQRYRRRPYRQVGLRELLCANTETRLAACQIRS